MIKSLTMAFILSLLPHLQAHAADCSALPPPAVTVTQLESPVVLDTTQNYRTITVLGQQDLQGDHRVLGLTKGTSQINVSVKMPYIADASGRWECFSPQITLTYGYAPMTVYIAREFPPDSCAYNEIYAHEMKHVAAYQEHAKAMAPLFNDALTKRFMTKSVWHGTASIARTNIESEINERWIAYFRSKLDSVSVTQKKIDSPQEYGRIAKSCEGAIEKVIKHQETQPRS